MFRVSHPLTLLSAPSQLLDKHASPNIGSNTSNFNSILEHDLVLYRCHALLIAMPLNLWNEHFSVAELETNAEGGGRLAG